MSARAAGFGAPAIPKRALVAAAALAGCALILSVRAARKRKDAPIAAAIIP